MRLVYRLVLLVLSLVLTILFWTQSDQTDGRSGLGQPRNEPIKLKNNEDDHDFDRRQRRRKELKNEINSDLIKLIKHGKCFAYAILPYGANLP